MDGDSLRRFARRDWMATTLVMNSDREPGVTRRRFLASMAGVPLLALNTARDEPAAWTWSVTGRIRTADLGTMLPHEHVLVDFAGADRVSPARYDADEVFDVALPHLRALRAAGCRALAECTPAYLGRDPRLLLRLSRASGVTLLTNTGYYGAANDKYVPPHARSATAEALAARWTAEVRDGIEGSGIRPGFIKIGVDPGPLSAIDRTLVSAAARCHRDTGLVICCHTGDGEAAFAALDTLRAAGVSPEAFVWVHAQNERDLALHLKAARAGAWVSLDGVGPSGLDAHVRAVRALADGGCLHRILVSQDAGWYHVGEPGGGSFRPYTGLFEAFLPALRAAGATEEQVQSIVTANPADAFAVRRRLLARHG